jgi:hypothetical protein
MRVVMVGRRRRRRRRRVGRRRCDCLMKPDADGNDEIVPI